MIRAPRRNGFMCSTSWAGNRLKPVRRGMEPAAVVDVKPTYNSGVEFPYVAVFLASVLCCGLFVFLLGLASVLALWRKVKQPGGG